MCTIVIQNARKTLCKYKASTKLEKNRLQHLQRVSESVHKNYGREV